MSISSTNAMLSTKSSFRGSRSGSTRSYKPGLPPVPPPSRPPRKKRSASNSLSSDSDVIRSIGSSQNLHPDFDTSSDERNKNKSSKGKKAPPLPANPPNLSEFTFRIIFLECFLTDLRIRSQITARRNVVGEVKVIGRTEGQQGQSGSERSVQPEGGRR